MYLKKNVLEIFDALKARWYSRIAIRDGLTNETESEAAQRSNAISESCRIYRTPRDPVAWNLMSVLNLI